MKTRRTIHEATGQGFRGFTILELLVAVTIAGALTLSLLATASHLFSAWRRTAAISAVRTQANGILDWLEADLGSAVFRRDDNVWLAATLQSSPQPPRGDAGTSDADWTGRVKPVDGLPASPGSSLDLQPASGDWADVRFGQAGLWLRFFTQQPDTNDGLQNLSAPRAVAYQLVRRRVTAGAGALAGDSAPARYLLYRSTARPFGPDWPDTNSTMGSGYDLFREDVVPHYNRADSSRIDQVGNIRSPRRFEQILANNVIDFGVRIWTRQRDGRESVSFPATDHLGRSKRGFAATIRDGQWRAPAALPPPLQGGRPWTPAELTYGFPVQIEVFVRILGEEGARLIEAFEQGRTVRPPSVATDAEQWWALARAHSSVFTRQIRIHATPR